MVNVFVIDHGFAVPIGRPMVEINTDEEMLSVSSLRDLIFETVALERDAYNLVVDGQRLENDDILDTTSISPVHLYNMLNAEEKVPVRTSFKGNLLSSVHTASTTVKEYERFLARKLLVRPAIMVLFSLGAFMEGHETLGLYVAGLPIDISLHVLEYKTRYDQVCISVKMRREPGYLTFVVDDVETFDILAGRLERIGELEWDEEVTFISGETVFDNWRTFREYNLTHAKLQILE